MTNPSPQQEPFKKKPSEGYIRYSGIGIQTVLIVAVGVFIGYELDTRVVKNGTNWFTVGFSMAFVIFAMFYMIKQFTRKD